MLKPYSVQCFTQKTGLHQVQISFLERPTLCCQGTNPFPEFRLHYE
jgi:hypothetical protein